MAQSTHMTQGFAGFAPDPTRSGHHDEQLPRVRGSFALQSQVVSVAADYNTVPVANQYGIQPRSNFKITSARVVGSSEVTHAVPNSNANFSRQHFQQYSAIPGAYHQGSGSAQYASNQPVSYGNAKQASRQPKSAADQQHVQSSKHQQPSRPALDNDRLNLPEEAGYKEIYNERIGRLQAIGIDLSHIKGTQDFVEQAFYLATRRYPNRLPPSPHIPEHYEQFPKNKNQRLNVLRAVENYALECEHANLGEQFELVEQLGIRIPKKYDGAPIYQLFRAVDKSAENRLTKGAYQRFQTWKEQANPRILQGNASEVEIINYAVQMLQQLAIGVTSLRKQQERDKKLLDNSGAQRQLNGTRQPMSSKLPQIDEMVQAEVSHQSIQIPRRHAASAAEQMNELRTSVAYLEKKLFGSNNSLTDSNDDHATYLNNVQKELSGLSHLESYDNLVAVISRCEKKYSNKLQERRSKHGKGSTPIIEMAFREFLLKELYKRLKPMAS